MIKEDITASLLGFLGKYIKVSGMDNDTDLFTSGLLNSLFAMQLVLFVEKKFCIKVENEDLHLDNFNCVNAIAALIIRKKTAGCGKTIEPENKIAPPEEQEEGVPCSH